MPAHSKKIIFFIVFVASIVLQNASMTYAQSIGPVKVVGRNLLVDFDGNGFYDPYVISGVGYSPYPIGAFPTQFGMCTTDPIGNFTCPGTTVYDDPAVLDRDFSILQNMKTNTIRTWGQVTPILLNKARDYNLKIVAGFWVDYSLDITSLTVRDSIKNDFINYVNLYKNYPAILIWAIGNENNLYIPTANLNQWYSLVNEMAQLAHAAEGATYHPVAVINGDILEIGNATYASRDVDLPSVDIWGTNVYRGSSFGSLFTDYASQSSKPLYISEFGIDAYDNNTGSLQTALQASWAAGLWDELVRSSDPYSRKGVTPVAIGGTLMEYSDEYWKAGGQWSVTALTQENGGVSLPGSSPDNFINEEWWGMMSIQDDGINLDIVTPREVYTTLSSRFNCVSLGRYHYAGAENNKLCPKGGTLSACCSNPNAKAYQSGCVNACPYPLPPLRQR